MQDSKKHIPIILGRPFLATSNAIINCKNGIMQLSFGNITIELNVFNVTKQLYDEDEIAKLDLIEALVEDSFVFNHCDDPLEICLTHFGLSFDVGSAIQVVNALLDSAPTMDTNKWQARVEPFPPSEKKISPSAEVPPKLKLKALPDTLEYAFLGESSTLTVIISSSLDSNQKDKLLDVLKKCK